MSDLNFNNNFDENKNNLTNLDDLNKIVDDIINFSDEDNYDGEKIIEPFTLMNLNFRELDLENNNNTKKPNSDNNCNQRKDTTNTLISLMETKDENSGNLVRSEVKCFSQKCENNFNTNLNKINNNNNSNSSKVYKFNSGQINSVNNINNLMNNMQTPNLQPMSSIYGTMVRNNSNFSQNSKNSNDSKFFPEGKKNTFNNNTNSFSNFNNTNTLNTQNIQSIQNYPNIPTNTLNTPNTIIINNLNTIGTSTNNIKLILLNLINSTYTDTIQYIKDYKNNLEGKLISIISTNIGSVLMQEYLKKISNTVTNNNNSEIINTNSMLYIIKTSMYNELKNQFIGLITHKFANYFLIELFYLLDESNRIHIIQLIISNPANNPNNNMNNITSVLIEELFKSKSALRFLGTIIQNKYIDNATSLLLIQSSINYFGIITKIFYGYKYLDTIIQSTSNISNNNSDLAFCSILNTLYNLAIQNMLIFISFIDGYYVLKRIILLIHDTNIQTTMVNSIIRNMDILLKTLYGSYLLENVMIHYKPHITLALVYKIKSNFLYLIINKFSFGFLVAVINQNKDYIIQLFINEIVYKKNLYLVMHYKHSILFMNKLFPLISLDIHRQMIISDIYQNIYMLGSNINNNGNNYNNPSNTNNAVNVELKKAWYDFLNFAIELNKNIMSNNSNYIGNNIYNSNNSNNMVMNTTNYNSNRNNNNNNNNANNTNNSNSNSCNNKKKNNNNKNKKKSSKK